MSWAGRWFRVTGILLLVATWRVAWLADGAFSKAGWMLLGLAIFYGSWSIAAWFDLHTCDIDGCNAPATTSVTGPNGLLEVCRNCRDGLVSRYGYKVTEDV